MRVQFHLWQLVGMIGLLLASAATAQGDSSGLLEVTVGRDQYEGRVVAECSQVCWLLDRSGQLHQLDPYDISDRRRLSSTFRSHSRDKVRDELRREFGQDFEVIGLGSYLVCGPRGRAKQYAEVLDGVRGNFFHYFRVRGFQLSQPEFPLVAVVFPSRSSFKEACRKDDVPAPDTLVGYYSCTTNRMVLYDDRQERLSGRLPRSPAGLLEDAQQLSRSPFSTTLGIFGNADETNSPVRWSGTIRGGLKDTLVHEATHQLAFNTGLHPRIGDTPRWIIEGLALVFEVPGIQESSPSVPAATRINRGRFWGFMNYVEKRRKQKSLADYVQSDRMFKTDTLDAYSQSWALTFYLIETRHYEFTKYLKTVAARDPLTTYKPEQRLADFKKHFGEDLDMLEVRFLR